MSKRRSKVFAHYCHAKERSEGLDKRFRNEPEP